MAANKEFPQLDFYNFLSYKKFPGSSGNCFLFKWADNIWDNPGSICQDKNYIGASAWCKCSSLYQFLHQHWLYTALSRTTSTTRQIISQLSGSLILLDSLCLRIWIKHDLKIRKFLILTQSKRSKMVRVMNCFLSTKSSLLYFYKKGFVRKSILIHQSRAPHPPLLILQCIISLAYSIPCLPLYVEVPDVLS